MTKPEGDLFQGDQPLSRRASTEPEQIDLQTAMGVLQSVVDTPETTISETSRLDLIGDHSLSQVRSAFEITARNVIASHTGIRDERQTPGGIFKEDANGKMLWIYLDRYRLEDPDTMAEVKAFALGNGPNLVVRFPLIEFNQQDEIDVFLHQLGGLYVDHQKGIAITPHTLSKHFRIEDYRLAFLGFRWLAYSILHWQDPNIITPEDLKRTPLSMQGIPLLE